MPRRVSQPGFCAVSISCASPYFTKEATPVEVMVAFIDAHWRRVAVVASGFRIRWARIQYCGDEGEHLGILAAPLMHELKDRCHQQIPATGTVVIHLMGECSHGIV